MSPSLFGRVMKLEPDTRHALLELVGGSEKSEDDITRIILDLERSAGSKPTRAQHLDS